MKTKVMITMLVSVAMILTTPLVTLGEKPPDAGNGGGGGGGGEPPVDYGDLIKLYRDADGVPHLTADSCWQPLPSDACRETAPENCTLLSGVGGGEPIPLVIPVNDNTCAVIDACATCTQEVDFGRISVARSSDEVFASQLADVVVNLATSDCEVSLDPAGRMVTSAGTIDSPLQNLAIYRQLMLTGTIGVSLAQDATILDTAARGLGVASDKTGEVNVDLVAYLNQIMGLSDPDTPTVLGKICIDVKEEVMGTVDMVQKCFLNYGPTTPPPEIVGANYAYTRLDNFSITDPSLPLPAYIPGPPDAPLDGRFEYLAVLDSGPPSFQILQGPILDAVFCVDDDGLPVDPVDGVCPEMIAEGFTEGNIGGFAQAADDTRAVINFMHNWPIPDADVFATPVSCVASVGTTYDVSISDVSGLQVPKNIVDGTEGREFIVTVANAGPDPATGTVTVTAVAESGGTIEDSPWVYVFTDVAQGESYVWIQDFSTTLGERTTINWTAIVAAPYDVNLPNNTVEATTNVKVTGGGGDQ